MKKLKTGLLALALVLGVSGAFVSKIHAAPKRDVDTYNWIRVAGSGQQGALSNKDVEDAQDFYGCSGTTDVCAHGENTNPDGPDADIFLN